ncbi:MAG: type II toxin-antitoxin system PemK/MazF family toxin [Gammaproteobacteria bacterium]|nr:type II toxin-antitoxin system PemK/MazF family toxin [Gammaproteobacteria bacterium]
MPAFKTWDVIKVPFPYTDRPVRQRRPALVVAADGLQEAHGLLWVMMITSAQNRGWSGDVDVSDLAASGLPVPSVIRTTKIATIEARDAEHLGSLASPDRAEVTEHLKAELNQVIIDE